MLASEAPKQEFLRRRLPHFEDREELAGYLAAVGDHLAAMLREPAFVDQMIGYLKDRTFEKVSGYRFPDRSGDRYFYVSRHRPEMPADPDDAAMLGWILEREVFWLSELNAAHGARGAIDDVLGLLRRLSGDAGIGIDEIVAASEAETGHRNASLAHFMKGFGNLEAPVEDVLDAYFHQCAIRMTCRQLALATRYLANSGRDPVSGEVVV